DRTNSAPMDRTQLPGWIENAYELLDQPGEWYLDLTMHLISYIPRPGENLATSRVVAGGLESVMRGDGTLDAPVHDIEFDGLTFAYTTWLAPNTRDGFSEEQANQYIAGLDAGRTQGQCLPGLPSTCPDHGFFKPPAAVWFRAARHVTFER